VDAFYSFWWNFKSWRDFAFEDEYDPNEAESREEKRWMERKIASKRYKKKMQEQARINKLVDLAYSLDPRIRKVREEEKAKKEKVKQDRRDAAKKREDEERQRLEEIAKKAEEEKKRQMEEVRMN